MDFRDERAGCVQHRQAARSGVVLHGARYAMRAEDRDRAGGHLGKVLDEAGALGLEAFDDVTVVHDLVAHVDGRSILLERLLHDVDGTHDAGAIAARLGEYHFHALRPVPVFGLPPLMDNTAFWRSRPDRGYHERSLSSDPLRLEIRCCDAAPYVPHGAICTSLPRTADDRTRPSARARSLVPPTRIARRRC